MKNNLTEKNVQDHILEKNWDAVREAVSELPAPDLVDLLMGLQKPEQIVLFSALPRGKMAEVFSFLIQ